MAWLIFLTFARTGPARPKPARQPMWIRSDSGKKSLPVLFVLLSLLTGWNAAAQQPFIHLVHPSEPVIKTSVTVNYLSGNTCRGCVLKAGGRTIKVYPQGGFALEVDLSGSDSTVALRAVAPSGTVAEKSVRFQFTPPQKDLPVADFRIASVTTDPTGPSWLLPGDLIRFQVRAQPGNQVSLDNRIPLYEQPADQEGGMQGVYQAVHVVVTDDPLLKKTSVITLKNASGQIATASLSPSVRVLDPAEPLVGLTTGALPYLEFGRGTDRLGGAKAGYLDTAVLVRVTGRFGDAYRVALAPGHTAYIPMGNLRLLPRGTFPPRSLTGSWRVWGDDRYDYVSIGLDEKLPYTLTQEPDPSRIVLDIYGATSNTNWISQFSSAREVKRVWYTQPEAGVFRVFIELKHPQIWGYRAYYTGHSTLTLRIKRQKQPLSLSHLTIAVDAGHGGTNRGAQGPTGVYEKDITLKIAMDLRDLLRQAGARVVMTRTADVSEDMIQRTLFLREADPDLLVSIHLNSSSDPIHVSGTSTYYRYIGFRPLSEAILRRMEGLGLEEYGNVGSFNFALNGPTGYPNALVETVFLSNPADEAKALDPAFRQKIAGAILAGIRDFLKEAAGPVPRTDR